MTSTRAAMSTWYTLPTSMPARPRTTSRVSRAVVSRFAPRPIVVAIAFSASSSRLRRSSATRGFSVRGPATGRGRPAGGRKASTTPASTTAPPATRARNS